MEGSEIIIDLDLVDGSYADRKLHLRWTPMWEVLFVNLCDQQREKNPSWKDKPPVPFMP